MAEEQGRHIRTRLNSGSDIRAGKYLLDGLAVGDNGELLAYEYNGCWVHQHLLANNQPCYLAKNSPNENGYKKWLEKKKYLEENGKF